MPYPSRRLGIALATGLSLATISPARQAAILDFHWNGLFTMLSPDGEALENTSLPKGMRFQTPIDGTLRIDTLAGTGQVLMEPFFFFGGPQPALASGFELQAIGDGMGGSGSLLLANLLFNWNSGIGIPVSMVLDAAGLYGAIASGGLAVGSQITATGANPASDGTWTGQGFDYLALGPTPIATTDWNTSPIPGCTLGDCLYLSNVGTLPLVTDTAANAWRYEMGTAQLLGDGTGVGGSPMLDGSFQGFNINFDFTDLTVTGIEVPLPAALWLFGTGLLGLLGGAWRDGNQDRQGGQ